MKKIGVLALQGAFREHINALKKCGVHGVEIRNRYDLTPEIDGVIIPGGESTTIGQLMIKYQLAEPLREMGSQGKPIWGTCAGLVLLAANISGREEQFRLGLIDVEVTRNAFGRQKESFEAALEIPVIGVAQFPAVFIRAPIITAVQSEVEILAFHNRDIVCARQGNILVSAFHPELTDDLRLHQYFLGF